VVPPNKDLQSRSSGLWCFFGGRQADCPQRQLLFSNALAPAESAICATQVNSSSGPAK
jgi:ribosomal protein S27E